MDFLCVLEKLVASAFAVTLGKELEITAGRQRMGMAEAPEEGQGNFPQPALFPNS